MSSDDSSTRSWESIADDWVTHADTNDYRNDFLMPHTFRLLGDVRLRRVLDLGCGEGGYSRELARRGAKVTGVDGSARLIEVARSFHNQGRATPDAGFAWARNGDNRRLTEFQGALLLAQLERLEEQSRTREANA